MSNDLCENQDDCFRRHDRIEKLEQKLAEARGHMRLYRLFSCEGGDSYDPECAEKNLDKVMEILDK